MVLNKLLKGNADKYNFLVNTGPEVSLNGNKFKIEKSNCEKPLDIRFDYKLRFDQHNTDFCRKGSRKVHALARVTPLISLSKRRLLMNTFLRRSLITVH